MADHESPNPIDEYNNRVTRERRAESSSDFHFGIKIYAIMLIPLVLMIAYMFYQNSLGRPPLPYVNAYIKGEPYVWPAGCTENSIITSSVESLGITFTNTSAPKACANEKYSADEIAYQYGFRQSPYYHSVKGGGGKFYRIGNDVVELSCGYWETCSVRNKFSGVFYQ